MSKPFPFSEARIKALKPPAVLRLLGALIFEMAIWEWRGWRLEMLRGVEVGESEFEPFLVESQAVGYNGRATRKPGYVASTFN